MTGKNSTPAIVHAFGGSIGSALSLFLLYPLERARIELQASVAHNEDSSSKSSSRQGNSGAKDFVLTDDSKPYSGENVPVQQIHSSHPPSPSHSQSNREHKSHPTNVEEKIKEDSKSIKSNSSAGTTSFVVIQDQSSPEISTSSSSSSSSNQSHEQDHLHTQLQEDEGEDIQHSSHQKDTSKPIKVEISSNINQKVPNNEKAISSPKSRSPEVWKQIVKLYESGELYRGVRPIVTTLAISNFVFFYAHEMIKRLFSGPTLTKHSSVAHRKLALSHRSKAASIWKSLFASTLAGIINVLLTNPLWVANMRIVQGGKNKSDKENMVTADKDSDSIFETIRTIIRNEGLKQLWSGTFASLLLVSNPAIQHFAYERVRSQILQVKSKQQSRHNHAIASKYGLGSRFTISPMEAFFVGAFAKAVATVATYPLQLAQVLLRLQKKRANHGKNGNKGPQDKVGLENSKDTTMEYQNTLDCVIQLYRKGGLSGLYSGMNAKLVQTVLTSAFTFLTYEQILKVVETAYFTIQDAK